MKFLEYDELDSTNVQAGRLVAEGEVSPFWVRATRQSSGRGRRGRDWVSPFGNFYGSACYDYKGSVEDAAKLSFVAAIAVYETLCAYSLTAKPVLKWPNDILIDGRKIAGLLLEAKHGKIIIGVGVNLINHPPEGNIAPTHLLEHIDPAALNCEEPEFTGAEAFLAIIAAKLDQAIKKHLAYGFSATRADWLSRSGGIPGPVTVRLPDETFEGEAEDLLENGALRIRLKDGTYRDIHAGDVFFGTEP